MNVTKQLYQWDTGQKLTECTGIYVDYLIGDEVYRVEITDGTCIIPDELLQTSGSHTVYECMTNNTIQSFAFSVIPRPKPPEYVFTPTERLTFEGLVQKVDDAVADMIRRAESGEFDGHTPVKGTDYFTAPEIQQIQNEVSSGAIGEFKSAVNTETNKFNANATEKVNAYNQNDSEKTTSYNANATEKLNAYNSNAGTKLNAYNTNANNKVAEFDSHTEQIQTDISELKSDLTGLQTIVYTKANQSDIDRTNRYLDALYKLNKGQTYDVLQQESEAYSVDVPSGSKYVGVDMVGGKSVAWNQLCPHSYPSGTESGITYTNNGDGSYTLNGTCTKTSYLWFINTYTVPDIIKPNHKYLCTTGRKSSDVDVVFQFILYDGLVVQGADSKIASTPSSLDSYSRFAYVVRFWVGSTYDNAVIEPMLIDLTQMFGSTIADYIYNLEQSSTGAGVAWFKKLFPADYYPYSEPTIISSQTDRVDVASADGTISQQITTNFPVLNSAGSVYDYIDLNEGKLHQRIGVVDLGTLKWTYYPSETAFYCTINVMNRKNGNLLCSKYTKSLQEVSDLNNMEFSYQSGIETTLWFKNTAYTDTATFKTAMSGVMLYYELAEPVITDIEIPTELSDWLTVEAGGSITFHNTDEGKRLLIPNKLSFIRKLDEVTV